MAEIEVINFADTPSIVNRYMLELRDINIQKDPLRFRTNLDRIGEIMAYEISKRLNYKNTEVQTPLGMSVCREPSDNIVLATILRAGLPFHHGFLNYFDRAENAFVSAYRKYKEKGDTFDVLIEYLASPSIEGKDPASCRPDAGDRQLDGTCLSRSLLSKGEPARIHIASVIALTPECEIYLRPFPRQKRPLYGAETSMKRSMRIHISCGSQQDASDLAFGTKE